MQVFNVFRARGTTKQQSKHPHDEQSLSDMNVERIESAENDRYDAMTQAERDAYYVNPTLLTRMKKYLFGK